jgi:hypothetical protein
MTIIVGSQFSTPYNAIINGNFDLFQRDANAGGIALSAGTFAYCADRFGGSNNGSTAKNMTMVLDTDVPLITQTPGWQSLYSLKFTNNTSSPITQTNDYMQLLHYIEGYNYQILHGQSITLSFWIKNSVTGTYSVAFNNNANTRSYVTTYTVANTNWNLYTFNIPLDTTGTWAFDHNPGLKIFWTLSGGTSNQTSTLNSWQTVTPTITIANTQTNTWASTNGATFRIAQVQLAPVGQWSSTYVRAGGTYLGEQLKCYRYYWRPGWDTRSPGGDGTQNCGITGTAVNSSSAQCPIIFLTEMRQAPSVTGNGMTTFLLYAGGTTVTSVTASAGALTKTRGFISLSYSSTGSSATGAPVTLEYSSTANFLALDAEY